MYSSKIGAGVSLEKRLPPSLVPRPRGSSPQPCSLGLSHPGKQVRAALDDDGEQLVKVGLVSP